MSDFLVVSYDLSPVNVLETVAAQAAEVVLQEAQKAKKD